MPVKRDAHGNIIDELTRRVDQGEPPPPPQRRTVDITGKSELRGHEPTRPTGGALGAGGKYDQPTTPVGDQGRPAPDDDYTRIVRRGPRRSDGDASAGAALQAPALHDRVDPMDDPPVGWLVVVDGPGKGSVVTLGIGVNSIGRDQSERVSLDFGDNMISRSEQGTITYDREGRKFYVQPGRGKNLTYVEDGPVLEARELVPSTQLRMGETVLRFVPLCGADFSWDDDDSGGE